VPHAEQSEPSTTAVKEGRRRVVVTGVTPEVESGAYPAKRTVGELLTVEADVFADGHDAVRAVVRWRPEDEKDWREVAMEPLGNDRWRASFPIERLVGHRYTVRGWVDRFATWAGDTAKKVAAKLDVSVELLAGAELVEQAVPRAPGPDRKALRKAAATLRAGGSEALEAVVSEDLAAMMRAASDRRYAVTYQRELLVEVDRERARFSTWYEMFPRSAAEEHGRHGTFKDVERLLPYVAGMGFDVLYLPPIHPIGTTFRKGPNNDPEGGPTDPGSPWAIGSPEGGHTAIHPDLGTIEDFDRLVGAATDHGIEVALDVAFQCSPDHPWVTEHPDWFRHRPDGTIQYAENPPKKYQDIYPLDFETEDWRGLWAGLKGVVDHWVDHGVRIFRVDNPHTKAFEFWRWTIGEVRSKNPDVLFLSEAFTRPKVMYHLAKIGFSQSYTYFTWRTTKHDIEEYLTELTGTGVADFFRPNLWPNTPDILGEPLQIGGRAAFLIRLVLAATLGASYGIYGPAFELMESTPVEPGKEEYLHSEKYEVRTWDRGRKDSLAEVIGQVNRLRAENPALQSDRSLRFHTIDNDNLIAYSKHTPDGANTIVVVVNLDPHHTQSGWVHLPLEDLGVEGDRPYQVHDLLGGGRYLWSGEHNFVELNPHVLPAHILLLRRRVRTERDFEYFM
jgi:starch synthase (maltosyl-transferring)